MSDLNGLYTNNVITGMLEGKDLYQLDSVFPLIATYVEKAVGEEYRHTTAHVHTTFLSFDIYQTVKI